jgi:hypothetical protein
MPRNPRGGRQPVRLRVAEPARVAEVHRAMLRAAEAAAASSVEAFLTELETWAQGIFAAAELPPWQSVVRIKADGDWVDDLSQGDLEALLAQLRPGERLETLGWIIERQYEGPSKERYAYDLLQSLHHLQHAQAARDIDAVLRASHRLYTLVAHMTIALAWEADALFGRRIREGARQGGQARAHQRRAERQERLGTWHHAAECIQRRHPKWSKFRVAKQVSKQVGGSVHTIRKIL